MGNTGFSTRESQIILTRWRSFIDFICKGYPTYMKGKHLKHRFDLVLMNQRYVLTTVKLKDLLSLFVIGLHKVQTQNLLFTFTWNVKRAQNNFVPIFNSKVGVRLIHQCDLYSSKYGI